MHECDQKDYKVFNDAVHGSIQVHPLCVKVIDTPQFQRLRLIRQVGLAYYVYPGAALNRFEHSVGVCYLAGLFARTLRDRQPCLGISPADILCLELAGLCHDLGHGPFSHLWEVFMDRVAQHKGWKHETASVAMFDYLLEENDLKVEFENYGLDKVKDLTFIKELICHPQGQDQSQGQPWPYQGRPQSKGFLYQIVANRENSVDVDKWDYFLRDSHSLGIQVTFDYSRLIKFSRVLDVVDSESDTPTPTPTPTPTSTSTQTPTTSTPTSTSTSTQTPTSTPTSTSTSTSPITSTQTPPPPPPPPPPPSPPPPPTPTRRICFRDKEASSLYDMFRTRMMLHKKAYQHKVVKMLDTMMVDALVKADQHITYRSKEGREFPLSEVAFHPQVMTYLTDDILNRIYQSQSDHPDIRAARRIIHNILTRNHYRSIGRTSPTSLKLTSEDWMRRLREKLGGEGGCGEGGDGGDGGGLEVQMVKLNFGNEDRDPVTRVWFYAKENEEVFVRHRPDEVSHMLPSKWEERIFLVIYRLFEKDDLSPEQRETIKRVKKSFVETCEEFGLSCTLENKSK